MAGENFAIEYENGFSVSGNVVEDTVAFGPVFLPSVAIGVAAEINGGSYADGMIGMGFHSSCMDHLL